MTEPRVSCVVIGLDEAEHLSDALAALDSQDVERGACEVLYVDSGSKDGSCDIARAAGVDRVIEIARQSAAAGRNAGLAAARGEFVQFVDGDSCLEPGWIGEALRVLEARAELAAVEGHLRERHPNSSLLHGVCELDWPIEVGEVDFVGGNALYRRAALVESDGFDTRMRVGEEPELGVRLRARGWRFAHLDRPMARHDLALRGLADYCHQAYKGGLSCGLVVRATGGLRRGYWRQRLFNTVAWSAVLIGPLAAALVLLPFVPGFALLAAGLGGLFLGLLAAIKALRLRRPASPLLRIAYGVHSYLSKLPMSVGIAAAWLERRPADPRRSA